MAGVACVLQEEARLNELGSGGACTTRTAAGLEKIGFISVCFGEGKGHSFMVDFPRKEL